MSRKYLPGFTKLPGVVAIVTLIASCATGPTPSSVILARPTPPLLDTPVLFQRMMLPDNQPPDRLDMRAMPRRLVATARELTLPGGNGNVMTPWEFTLSFSTVESVEVGKITYDPLGPIGRDAIVDGTVTITDQRGVCKTACVFMFTDPNGEPDLTTANRFADIVRAGRESVDPFGRDDGPRSVAVAFGLRAPRPGWHRDIRMESPAIRDLADDIENDVLRYARSSLRSDFRQCLTTALNAGSASDGDSSTWSFEPISGLAINQDTEIDIASVLKSEELKRLGTNSMLVSDIYGMGFTYIPSIDSEPPRVETTYRAFVDFYDLEPLKDGRYFWFDFTQQHMMADFSADPAASVRQDIEHLCRTLSARIGTEIDLHAARPRTAKTPNESVLTLQDEALPVSSTKTGLSTEQ